MIKLSAVIITLNEERNIARCLSSLQGVADEIIVLDSFSTDKTEAICREYGVKFLAHPFEGHIQQKNMVADMASHPYVLALDADEALSEELRASILAVKENPEYDAYQFNRLTNYCGHWVTYAGWYPDVKLRLWKKNKGHWGGSNPHDKIIIEKGSSVGSLRGDLLHYSYYTISQHIKQTNSFSDIAAKEAFRKGEKASFLKIVLNPLFTFIKKYFFQRGFTGGWYGFIICINSAFGKFLKYVKLMELHQSAKAS
ncbi:glycosyltransferase family 2 protein [Nafulsella turpanensis]|uniref:glycosyltransferase family 2 protein n=1 Tax=Nafulsella turpanensis TaxID=1265690 RepID=UPI00034859F3|nr:glycosyltransferase family 2 protein [Nafulsella turpanensis]